MCSTYFNYFFKFDTGFVINWTPAIGFTELPETAGSYPNGIMLDIENNNLAVNYNLGDKTHLYNLDTMELWKFGDFKNYTSLDLLTYIFKIPTPKDDMDGSQVAKVFYQDKDLDRIIHYCEKDVVATIQLFRKYQGDSLIDKEFIQIA